tara:strand:- start:3399 stop:4523 length:1125 start_codon:yes stop_codon:yes gene_type:complete
MIRIDEIYNNTLWPWIKKNHPGVRMFLCDPFGRTDLDSLVNYGTDDIPEHNYTLLWDQEPIHLNIHSELFANVFHRNRDLRNATKYLCSTTNNHQIGSIITSEKNSDAVEHMCKKFDWKSYYYFFHGWAALDWYRGYNRTFLITPIEQRKIKKTFLAPNRIVAGERQHRLEMLYWIFKLGMTNNHISCPSVCPAENISIHDAILPLKKKYSDIDTIFNQQMLPINFKDETSHPMRSCWLDLFDQSAESLLYLVTETVARGRRYHLTEKTFKPIALGMPFVIVGTQGSLKYLRSYGFKTFGHLWDESYDNEPDDSQRIEKIAQVLKQLEHSDLQGIFESAHEIIEHNWNHFYNGGFEQILWQELQDMLNELEFNS